MYSIMIEDNPSLVLPEVEEPAPALLVYRLIVSFGIQKNIQLSDNEAASNDDAANGLTRLRGSGARFEIPTGPSITLFLANLAAMVTLFEPV